MAHSDILSQPDRGLGLDRPQTEALLALFSRCDDLREFGREVIQSVVNALMDSQAQEACGAPRGSRSPERVNSRNGYRERSLSTSLGDLELRVPKLREGTYFPEGILERYTRVEASMVALVREMYVAGVSTRKVGILILLYDLCSHYLSFLSYFTNAYSRSKYVCSSLSAVISQSGSSSRFGKYASASYAKSIFVT